MLLMSIGSNTKHQMLLDEAVIVVQCNEGGWIPNTASALAAAAMSVHDASLATAVAGTFQYLHAHNTAAPPPTTPSAHGREYHRNVVQRSRKRAKEQVEEKKAGKRARMQQLRRGPNVATTQQHCNTTDCNTTQQPNTANRHMQQPAAASQREQVANACV